MKKLCILIILAFIMMQANAQNDPKAKEILDKLSVKTKSYKSISADFSILYESEQEKIQNTSDGSIIIKNDSYKLDVMGNTIFFDGETVWTYMKEINEVNISYPEENQDDIFSNPKKLFTIYEENFKYRIKEEKIENGKKLSVIDLTPEDLDSEFARMLLTIDTDKVQIVSAKSISNDGTSFEIRIKNFITNKEFSDTNFKFKKKNYPDVEIIDLR